MFRPPNGGQIVSESPDDELIGEPEDGFPSVRAQALYQDLLDQADRIRESGGGDAAERRYQELADAYREELARARADDADRP
jgi:hypothetical protein